MALEASAGPISGAASFEATDRLCFWNARSALAHLLSTLEVRRVWLPAYICVEPAQAAALDGRQLKFYPVGADLIPGAQVLSDNLRAGDAVLGADYFGAPAEVLPELARRFTDVIWIQDRAQSLWPDPAPWGSYLLYSPRKVVGAPDGGVLVSRRGRLPSPAWTEDLDQSRLEPARMRAEDPLGLRNDAWFTGYRAAEAAMTCAPLPISGLSQAVIDAADTSSLLRRRRRNAQILLSQVGDSALLPADRLLAGAPLGVPVLTKDAGAVAERMAQAGVFCARHWARLPSPAADFPVEHDLSRRLLTLPSDHRYDENDMARVAETFLACR